MGVMEIIVIVTNTIKAGTISAHVLITKTGEKDIKEITLITVK